MNDFLGERERAVYTEELMLCSEAPRPLHMNSYSSCIIFDTHV